MEPKVSHFTIFRQPPNDEKRLKEQEHLYVLLRHLHTFKKFDDIRFGQPPEPDFIFHYQGKEIGAELTVLDPKHFLKGGFVKRGEFKEWEAEAEPNAERREFDWGTYALRDSLVC